MDPDFAPNRYSQRWFRSFHLPIEEARTLAEVNFICSFAPLPEFSRLADVCCGMGRHARALAGRGYDVTGIDRDPNIIAAARELAGGPRYIEADLRDYRPEPAESDGIIIMGQSFGHFDAATNQAVLGRLAVGLRDQGRLILDLWTPEFFQVHGGEREFRVADGIVRETKRVQDGRLLVHLDYPSGETEDFEWQLFTRAEIEDMAAPFRLKLVACCNDFDRSRGSLDSKPRVQYVLECEQNQGATDQLPCKTQQR